MSRNDFQNGFALGLVSGGVVEVADTTEIDALESLIDESRVLDSTEGTPTEKVGHLIEKAETENDWYSASESLTTISSFFTNSSLQKLPRMNPINAKSATYMCSGMKNLKRIDFYLDTKNAEDCNNMFNGCSALEFIKGVNTAKAKWVTNMFFGCNSLKTVEEPFDLSNCLTSSSGSIIMGGGEALENIRFVPESIKINFRADNWSSLSSECVQSIIDGLATVTTVQTLTLHKNIALTDQQKATINAKGWTLVQ